MSSEDRDFRRFVVDLAEDNQPEVRRRGPRSLVKYRVAWARRLAQKLAADPDPQVRKETQRLMAHWRDEDRRALHEPQ